MRVINTSSYSWLKIEKSVTRNRSTVMHCMVTWRTPARANNTVVPTRCQDLNMDLQWITISDVWYVKNSLVAQVLDIWISVMIICFSTQITERQDWQCTMTELTMHHYCNYSVSNQELAKSQSIRASMGGRRSMSLKKSILIHPTNSDKNINLPKIPWKKAF